MAVLFWLLFGLIVYHYFIYPLIIMMMARRTQNKPVIPEINEIKEHDLPSVSFIIAAYNEAAVIEDKIKNTLGLTYPEEKFEIIVASHGSDDETADIARSFENRGIISLHSDKREGKTAALNYAVAAASGEILVFSDANNMFSDDAIKYLVRHYSDDTIGGVCGLKSIISDAGRQSSDGDGLYWKYESAIKNAESQCKTITNADGEIFSLRRELYTPMDKSIINDDQEITFNLVNKGYRIVYEMKATSSELASIDLIDDYFVKVRMVAGSYQTLHRYFWQIFFPTTFFAWMFFSHKVLRWVMPMLLISFFFVTLMTLDQTIPKIFLYLQIVFYFMALLGFIFLRKVHKLKILYVPLYFVMMNVAVAHGFIRYLKKGQTANWRKAERVG